MQLRFINEVSVRSVVLVSRIGTATGIFIFIRLLVLLLLVLLIISISTVLLLLMPVRISERLFILACRGRIVRIFAATFRSYRVVGLLARLLELGRPLPHRLLGDAVVVVRRPSLLVPVFLPRLCLHV